MLCNQVLQPLTVLQLIAMTGSMNASLCNSTCRNCLSLVLPVMCTACHLYCLSFVLPVMCTACRVYCLSLVCLPDCQNTVRSLFAFTKCMFDVLCHQFCPPAPCAAAPGTMKASSTTTLSLPSQLDSVSRPISHTAAMCCSMLL